MTSVGDQVMLMGQNCSHIVCKMGCHCGLMEGAAWLRFSEGDSCVFYKVELLLELR